MKKVISLLAILMLFVVGCGKKEVVDYQAIMKTYADQYFIKFALPGLTGLGTQPITTDIFEIKISDLENVNKNGGADFDLKPLSKCEKSSVVHLILDKKNEKIASYEYNLKCEE